MFRPSVYLTLSPVQLHKQCSQTIFISNDDLLWKSMPAWRINCTTIVLVNENILLFVQFVPLYMCVFLPHTFFCQKMSIIDNYICGVEIHVYMTVSQMWEVLSIAVRISFLSFISFSPSLLVPSPPYLYRHDMAYIILYYITQNPNSFLNNDSWLKWLVLSRVILFYICDSLTKIDSSTIII